MMMTMEKKKEQSEQQIPLSSQYKAKIDGMQKYLPFLNKLIEKLQQDPENKPKVLQLQVLLKILLCQKPRTSLEDLIQCEESLEGIYKLYEPTAEAETNVKIDVQEGLKIHEHYKDQEVKNFKETAKAEHENKNNNSKQTKEVKAKSIENENGKSEIKKDTEENVIDKVDCSTKEGDKESKFGFEIKHFETSKHEIKVNIQEVKSTEIQKKIAEKETKKQKMEDDVSKKDENRKKLDDKEITEKEVDKSKCTNDNESSNGKGITTKILDNESIAKINKTFEYKYQENIITLKETNEKITQNGVTSTEKGNGKETCKNETNLGTIKNKSTIIKTVESDKSKIMNEHKENTVEDIKERVTEKEVDTETLKEKNIQEKEKSEKVEHFKEKTVTEAIKNATKEKERSEITDLIENQTEKAVTEKEKIKMFENLKETIGYDISKNDKGIKKKNESAVEKEHELQQDNMIEIAKSAEEEEIEENVEVINMPDEDDEEEMILPDLADEMEQINTAGSQMKNSYENEEFKKDSMVEENEKEDTKKPSVEENCVEEKENQQTYEQTAEEMTIGENENQEAKEPTIEKNAVKETPTKSDDQGDTPAEAELLTLEEVNTSVSKTAQDFDPLQYEETTEDVQQLVRSKPVTAAPEIVTYNIDDDDDDVQIIEDRNSPICIPSDSDDEVHNAATITVENRTVVTVATVPNQRTFARKSTAQQSAATVPQIQRKPKDISYLSQTCVSVAHNRLVDTVLLLDSSDDEQDKSVTLKQFENISIGHISSKRYRYSTTSNTNNYIKPSNAKSNNTNDTNAQQVIAQAKYTLMSTATPPLPTTVTKRLPTLSNNQSIVGKKLRTLAPTSHKVGVKSTKITTPTTKIISSTTTTAKAAVTTVATPQTNFLNAVNLQPTVPGEQPAAFLATLLNKKVIIPNAFYGNQRVEDNIVATSKKPPPPAAAEEIQSDFHDRRWLENFLTHFSNPQEMASHRCYVLLQRVLNYNTFTRLRNRRMQLNVRAHGACEQVDVELLLDLRNVFYLGTKGSKQLSEAGRRLCELSRSMLQGRVVALTTNARSGHITTSTRTLGHDPKSVSGAQQQQQQPKIIVSGATGTVTISSIFDEATPNNIASSAVTTLTAGARKRQREDTEYMPNKAVSIFDGETSTERKRSLRAKRARRYDEDSYVRDEEFVSEDCDSSESYAAVQRKVEQKRLEAQRQREEQVKSFESAFVQTFREQDDLNKTTDAVPSTSRTFRKRLCDEDAQKFAANADDYDLLTPTWIECAPNQSKTIVSNILNEDDGALSMDDNEPREHRIYKVIPTKLISVKMAKGDAEQEVTVQQQQQQLQLQQQLQKEASKRIRGRPRKAQSNEPEIIICDDVDDADEGSSSYASKETADVVAIDSEEQSTETQPSEPPKNTDSAMHTLSEYMEWCVLCNRRVPRIVHHYVNDHRGSEVYNSRLSSDQVRHLITNPRLTAKLHIYKNGQLQFEAGCIFCKKQSRFMLPYWYQHFAMHTGEYAYRCSGCGIRKPTRSLLKAHVNQPCPKLGRLCQDYTPTSKLQHIEAHMCTLCNYVQLYRPRVMRHLHTQHNIFGIWAKHVHVLELLRLPYSLVEEAKKLPTVNKIEEGSAVPLQQQDESLFNPDTDTLWQAGQWDDGDPSDDLSFMISGMLDVQMNTD